MADYGGDLQDLENFLVKVAGSFECISELSEEISRYIDGTQSNITNGVTASLQADVRAHLGGPSSRGSAAR